MMTTTQILKNLDGASALQLCEALRTVLHEQEAERIARAIEYTRQQYCGGFMSHATMSSHVRSLIGTAAAKGVKALVEEKLAVGVDARLRAAMDAWKQAEQ